VRDLLPAAREGQGLVTELARFSRAAVPALDKLAPFSAKASTFVPPLAAFLRQGNPMFAYIAPYFREVGTFFANDAASFQHTDALGHVARIVLPISRSNAAGVFTPEQDRTLQRLSGASDTRGNNAYPAPGRAGGSESFTGTYPRLEADPPYLR
jgi:phospholipid/cholesterol/gamma-HCH transport system substrate-binding protein